MEEMNRKIITMVHTVLPVVDTMMQTFANDSRRSSVELYNIVDDAIIPRVRSLGISGVSRIVYQHLLAAEDHGSQVILVTCSSLSSLVDTLRPLIRIPVVKIDEAMIDQAVQAGGRLAVVATVETTLGPTLAQLQKKVADVANAARPLEIVPCLCAEAYTALLRENSPEKHDALVAAAVRKLLPEVDAIMLAQVSMVRVLPAIRQMTDKPIFTSPESAVDRVFDIIGKR